MLNDGIKNLGQAQPWLQIGIIELFLSLNKVLMIYKVLMV